MEKTITGSAQWLQSYDTAATMSGVDRNFFSPNNSCRAIDHHHRCQQQQSRQFSPKGCGCVSKSIPIRRRSRASKRTPTTLLNANTTNFRALVQQFTGCPRSPISFTAEKGPITLNFVSGTAHNKYCARENFHDKIHRQHTQQENWSQQNKQQQLQQQQQHQKHQQHQQHQQQQEQEKQQHYSVEHILDSFSNDAGSNSGSSNVEVDDEFVLDDLDLEELTREFSLSNEYS